MNSIYSYSLFKIEVKSKLASILNRKKHKGFFLNYKYAFNLKSGLEIGGPSSLFSSDILPVYNWAAQIDGCNFSSNTLWEGAITDTVYRYSPNRTGKQFILDGTDLNEIESEKYDFLLSSHCLEHIANPLRAIQEWIRVLKPGGFLLLVVPHKTNTFDHRRNYTSFSHILSDYRMDRKEDDLTHLPEILELHDLDLDPGAGKDFNTFKRRSENNFQNRALHHHVFSQSVLKQAFDYFNMRTTVQYFHPPVNQIIIGQKGG